MSRDRVVFDASHQLGRDHREHDCRQPSPAAWSRRVLRAYIVGKLVPEVIEMPLIGDPPNNLAAVSQIRAAIADDADSGIFIMSEHGGCQPGSRGKRLRSS